MLSGKEYIGLLNEIRQEVMEGRVAAIRAVNKEMINRYWEIGKKIVERQREYGWGKSVVEQLAADLKRELPGTAGFSAANLWRMRLLYHEYTQPVFLAQAVRELKTDTEKITSKVLDLVSSVPWGQNVLILEKLKLPSERIYYLSKTVQSGWSRNMLHHFIISNAYAASLSQNKQHNFSKTLPEHLAEQAEETIRSNYNLEFLGVGKGVKEMEVEHKMIAQIRDVLLAFGCGFSYLGHQYPVKLDVKSYYIDLLFYHRQLQCLVAVELKTGAFKPEYAGKLSFYLEVLDDTVKLPHENPSLGILLCADNNKMEVEYALRASNKPIGVAGYQLTRQLPEELLRSLPDSKELSRMLMHAQDVSSNA